MKFYVLYLIICSFAALILYGMDKLRAKLRRWRIRESVLLTISLCGGAVGALLGMLLFRHKTKHWYFFAVAFLGLAWQLALLFFLLQ